MFPVDDQQVFFIALHKKAMPVSTEFAVTKFDACQRRDDTACLTITAVPDDQFRRRAGRILNDRNKFALRMEDGRKLRVTVVNHIQSVQQSSCSNFPDLQSLLRLDSCAGSGRIDSDRSAARQLRTGKLFVGFEVKNSGIPFGRRNHQIPTRRIKRRADRPGDRNRSG